MIGEIGRLFVGIRYLFVSYVLLQELKRALEIPALRL